MGTQKIAKMLVFAKGKALTKVKEGGLETRSVYCLYIGSNNDMFLKFCQFFKF